MNPWAVAFVFWIVVILIVLLASPIDDDEESRPFNLEDYRYGNDSVSRESEEE